MSLARLCCLSFVSPFHCWIVPSCLWLRVYSGRCCLDFCSALHSNVSCFLFPCAFSPFEMKLVSWIWLSERLLSARFCCLIYPPFFVLVQPASSTVDSRSSSIAFHSHCLALVLPFTPNISETIFPSTQKRWNSHRPTLSIPFHFLRNSRLLYAFRLAPPSVLPDVFS